MRLRDLFNQRRWATGDLAALTIVVRHRGAPDDRRVVEGAAIVGVLPGGLHVGDEGVEEPVFLPWHRVLAVREGDVVLWEKP